MALPQEYQDEVRRIVREEIAPLGNTGTLDIAHNAIQRLERDNEDLRGALQMAKDRADGHSKTVISLQKANVELQQRLTTRDNLLDEREEQLEKMAKERDAEKLRGDIAVAQRGEFKDKFEKLAGENHALVGQNKRLIAESDGLRQAPEVLKTELGSIIQEISQQRDALQTQLTNQKTEAAREVNRVAQQRDHWMKKCEELARKVDEATERIKSHVSGAEVLRKERDDALAACSQREQALAVAQDAIRDLERDRDELTEKLRRTTEKLDYMHTQATSMLQVLKAGTQQQARTKE